MPMLFGAALLTIYIVLGILYESLIHPMTILSTLFSASVGAALALWIFDTPFTVIAAIGVLLLIGIVKKNAIMMVDFALEARAEGRTHARRSSRLVSCLPPDHDDDFRRHLRRFAARLRNRGRLGVAPSARHHDCRRAYRQQALTLYTTPVVFIYLDAFGNFLGRLWNRFYLRLDPRRAHTSARPVTSQVRRRCIGRSY